MAFECSKEFETVYLKENPFPDAEVCVSEDHSSKSWDKIFQYCNKILVVWNIGGPAIQDFPSDFAYPIEDDFKYFFIQIHYNNPNQIPSNLTLS
jgi:hypothetical protein